MAFRTTTFTLCFGLFFRSFICFFFETTCVRMGDSLYKGVYIFLFGRLYKGVYCPNGISMADLKNWIWLYPIYLTVARAMRACNFG